MTDIIERLKDQSLQLARRSFDSVDAGLAANVADAAIDEIERLRAELDSTNNHLDAAYEAAGLSQTSSKPLAYHIMELIYAQPRYFTGCLRYGYCRGVCRDKDCPNYDLVVAARLVVENRVEGIVYPDGES